MPKPQTFTAKMSTAVSRWHIHWYCHIWNTNTQQTATQCYKDIQRPSTTSTRIWRPRLTWPSWLSTCHPMNYLDCLHRLHNEYNAKNKLHQPTIPYTTLYKINTHQFYYRNEITPQTNNNHIKSSTVNKQWKAQSR